MPLRNPPRQPRSVLQRQLRVRHLRRAPRLQVLRGPARPWASGPRHVQQKVLRGDRVNRVLERPQVCAPQRLDRGSSAQGPKGNAPGVRLRAFLNVQADLDPVVRAVNGRAALAWAEFRKLSRANRFTLANHPQQPDVLGR